MNPFLHSESLAAVFIVVNQKVYRSIRGDGRQLAILYVGTNKTPPANANEELLDLHREVTGEDAATGFQPSVVPSTEPPWTLTVHFEDPDAGTLPQEDKVHHWIARDFKERPSEFGPPIPAAGELNQALMIFQQDVEGDLDAIDNLQAIKNKAKTPTWVTLYATQTDAQGLGDGAGDYGSARDLDV